MNLSDQAVEFIVIIVYMLFLLGIGLAFRSFNSNISDFFRGGGRGTWWLVGSSAFMAGISAYTFTGASGVAFNSGWSVSAIYIGNALGYFLAFLVFAPWFRQLRAITSPELIRLRFGVGTQQFYSYFGILVSLVGGGLQLWAMAIFTSAVFGLEIWLVIIAIGAVVVFYSTTGGSWAVMATDFVQSLIMVPLTILIGVLCLIEVGWFSGLNSMVNEANLSDQFRIINEPDAATNYQYGLFWVIAIIFNQAFLSNTIGSAQRYFSVKDGREARKAAFLAFALMGLGCIFWFIPPMVARVLYEADVMAMGARLNEPAEAAYATISMRVLPLGMTGLIVVAMFSATMSSLDSGINRNAGIFIRDIYPALCRWAKVDIVHEERQLYLSRVFSIIFGVIIIAIAVYFSQVGGRGMFTVMLNISSMLGVPLSVPMTLGLFFRRVPGWSAMVSVIAGLLPSVVAMIMGWEWNFQTKVFMNFGFGTAAFLLTMPFWKTVSEDYRQQVNEFFTRMRTPVDFEKEVGGANDLRQLSLIGSFTAAVGGFILLLIFLPNELIGRVSIVMLSLTVVGIGLLMMYLGRKSTKS